MLRLIPASRRLVRNANTIHPASSSSCSSSGAKRWHGGPEVGDDAAEIDVSFLQPDGSTMEVHAKVGETLLQTAQRYGIELEGACEGKH